MADWKVTELSSNLRSFYIALFCPYANSAKVKIPFEELVITKTFPILLQYYYVNIIYFLQNK